MTCPFCDSEMINGKLLGDRIKLRWIPDGERVPLTILGKSSNTIIPTHSNPFGGRPYVVAPLCEKCKKLIIDL